MGLKALLVKFQSLIGILLGVRTRAEKFPELKFQSLIGILLGFTSFYCSLDSHEFQSLIGILLGNYLAVMGFYLANLFQSLIGILLGRHATNACRLNQSISIPYRYSTRLQRIAKGFTSDPSLAATFTFTDPLREGMCTKEAT